MTYRIVPTVLLTLAAVHTLPAQNLTARQLFYKEDADAKPAATTPAPPKTPPKAAPKKAAPKAIPAPPKAPTSSEVATPRVESVPVQSAAYTSERPMGLRYALVQVVNGVESEVSPTATFHSGDMVRVN